MDAFDRAISESIHSGIEPFQQRFAGVYDGYSESPIAYRSRTILFTAATGAIENYYELVANKEIGARITLRDLVHAIRTMQDLSDRDSTVKWIGIEATPSLLRQENLYETVKGLLAKEHCVDASKICFVFPPLVTGAGRDLYKDGLADLKALGFTIALAPIGTDFCPSTLMGSAIDYVVLSAELTALSTDRNNPGVLAALIGLIHTMGVSVIAEGVTSDDQIRELTVVECFGFIPASTYKGEFMLPKRAQTKEEILSSEASV